ncbi:MAG: hypothetical protein ACKV2T_27890 [Kofleriaceae bacterium]
MGRRVCHEVRADRVDIRTCLEKLDDVGTVLLSACLELQVDKGTDLDRGARLGVERGREVSFAIADRQKVNRHPVDLDRDSRAHHHEAAGVPLERFVADEEVDIFRRSRMSIRTNGEPTDDDMADTSRTESGRCNTHGVQDLRGDDIFE